MTSIESVTLSLHENSHAFICEAVSKAIAAQDDIRQWQFAVLALVQSAELSLKAALNAIHPILVYENVDKPSRTVTLHAALARLENSDIGAMTFSQRDKRRIDKASKSRNEMTHSEFELTSKYAAANFFELFGFVSDFQRRHLSCDLSEIIPAADFEKLIGIRRAIEVLVRRARERIQQEGVDSQQIWACPNCGEDTYVFDGDINICYACSCAEDVVECPQCKELCFGFELESFFNEIDSYFDEGQAVVHNSYGYKDFNACPACLPKIKETIQDERESNEMRRLEEEYYRRDA
ncbi:MAG: hypothetical protein ACIAS6_03825 [Phycisphaerales bacterium JB060]